MSYQEYLPHTPYDELPAAARAAIERAPYERLRRATTALAAPSALPPTLAAAYRARIAAMPVAAAAVGHTAAWRVAALLGWGLLVIGAGTWWWQSPGPHVIYRDAPPPPAEVVVRYDTVTTVRTELRERIRTVRDTVYLPPGPPVVRTDTVYAPLLSPSTGPSSRSVADGPDWRRLTVSGSTFSESR